MQTGGYIKIMLFVLFFIYSGFLIFYKRFDLYKVRWAGGVLLFLILCLLGFILLLSKSGKRDLSHFSRFSESLLTGIIVSDPKQAGEVTRFIAEISGGIYDGKYRRLAGNLLISVKLTDTGKTGYRYGDLILIPASYKEVQSPLNPSEFDYKEYLSHQSVFHQIFIKEKQICVLQRHQGNPVIDFAISLRHRLVERFNRFIKNQDAAAVASTLILGYRASLSPEIISAYSSTGTMHVLSVSGMHIGIVFLVLDILLKKMQRTGMQKFLRTCILLLFIWIYALITGFSPAVCRAVLMFSFVIIGKAANRSMNTYNLLAVSAVLLLIYNPFFLVDVGFQLSYLAVTGLVYFYPKIYHSVWFKNKLVDKIWSYMSVSISAQLATFPVSIYYFHQFPVYFLISNLFIIVPVAVIMYSGLIFILFPVDVLSRLTGSFLNISLEFTNHVLHYIENFPFSVINIWINVWEYLLVYALILLLFLFFYFKRRRRILMRLSLLLILVLLLGNTAEDIDQQRTCKVICFSLRNHSAVGFIEGKRGVLFTDLSSNDKTFSFSVAPAFKSRHIEVVNRPFGTAIEENNLFSDGYFIQFRYWKMLICGRNFNHFSTNNQVGVDAVLIRDNSPVDLYELHKVLKFNILLIDGSNTYYHTYRLQQQARRLNINYYVLKGNPAYSVDL